MTGWRTYITLIAMVLFNIFTAVFKIEGLSQESVEATINLQIPFGATSPSNPTTGQLFFNTMGDSLYIYDGSTWKKIPTE